MIPIDGGPATDRVLLRFARELERQSPRVVPSPPDLRGIAARDLDAARWAWSVRIVDEYRSVVVFTELFECLARIAAPYPMLCAVQRIIGDELRHAALCSRAASWVGALDELDVDLRELGLPRDDAPPEDRALRIVLRELVVAEAESVNVLRAFRDAATLPSFRGVLQILLMDEARHAAAGRALARSLARALDPDRLAAARQRFEPELLEDQRHLRATYRASATDGPGRALGASIRPDELRSGADRPPRWW